jgi:hypothetical protein
MISTLIISEDLTIIKKIDLILLLKVSLCAKIRGYHCAKGFLFVPDGCGVSWVVTLANARRF